MSGQEALLVAQEMESLCFRKGRLSARDVGGRGAEADSGMGAGGPVSSKLARGNDPGKETEQAKGEVSFLRNLRSLIRL